MLGRILSTPSPEPDPSPVSEVSQLAPSTALAPRMIVATVKEEKSELRVLMSGTRIFLVSYSRVRLLQRLT